MTDNCKITDLDLINPKCLVVDDEGSGYGPTQYTGLILIPPQYVDEISKLDIEAYLGELEGKHSEVICPTEMKTWTKDEVYKFILNKDYWCAEEILTALKHEIQDEHPEDYEVIKRLNVEFYKAVKVVNNTQITEYGETTEHSVQNKAESLLDTRWL